jgi:hypothetical protein
MRRSHRLLILTGLAVPVLVAGLVVPNAYAKGPKTQKPVRVTCTMLSGNAASPTNPPTLSKCNEPAVTGGSGQFLAAGGLGISGNATVTWNGTGTTTFSYSTTAPKGDKCPMDSTSPGNRQTEEILHGVVRSNTETNPATDGGVKAAVTAKICVTSALDLTLLPPKPFML